MTIVEYLEYEKKVNENHINNTKSYLPTYLGKSTPTYDPIREFAHYFDPNQPGVESDCDSKDMEEGVEYMIDDEVVMSKKEESNHGYTQSIQHFEEKDEVDEWLNAEITKHMSMQGVENIKDALISIIKSIRQEMKDGILKRKFESSTASVSDEVSSIASNEVDKADENTSNTAPCSKKFKFNIDSYQSIEKNYMVDIAQEEETFNPLEIGIDLFSYESPAWLDFEQRTRSYGTPSPQDEIAKPISFSPDRRGLVKRWHVCKPIHVTYDDGSGEDCRMWSTCDPDLKFCFGYNEVFGVNGQGLLRLISMIQHENEVLTPQGHQGDDEPRPMRPRPCNYSFEEWLKIKIGHNNLHESDREFIFNEWILNSYDVEEEYTKEIGNQYSRRFDKDNMVFNNEIEHLSNEYNLRIGKKGYVLDDVWEKCQQNYKKTNEAWHDEGYEEDEIWRSGDEKTDYNPPSLPLGRVNGARFKAMIRKELEGNKIQKLGGNYRDQLDS
ncbi:hypothetical protein Tco_0610593 [Tanacetum coccineum]